MRGRQVGRRVGVALLLRGSVDALGRRPEAAQQRVDGQRHGAEHRDLAERVEAAEVDQHHVDDVGAAAFGQRALEEEAARCVSGSGRVSTA